MIKKFFRDKSNFIFVLIIAFVVSFPLMTDYVFAGDCTASSLSHIEAAFRGLGKVFPIRIGTLGASAYGYSAAAFQADVFYLIPAFMRLAGMSVGAAFKITIFIFNLLTAIIAFRCFLICFKDAKLGILGSMFYTWCPYRINSAYVSGNLSEVFAWTFIPLVILGMYRLYGNGTLKSEKSRMYGAWLCLTWGLSLIALSSTVVLFVVSCAVCIYALINIKKTFGKERILTILSVAAAVVLINAWFVIPMLLRMRDANAVGAMIAENIRNYALQPVVYLKVFNFGGDSLNFVENGIARAAAIGPGAAVVMFVMVFLWAGFSGISKATERVKGAEILEKNEGMEIIGDLKIGGFCSSLLLTSAVFVILSLDIFPWDIFQNKNMLFSIILALMETPAKFAIAADICFIILAIKGIKMLKQIGGEEIYSYGKAFAGGISFLTTQFMLGRILFTRGFADNAKAAELSQIPFPLILEESVLWRLTEVVSVISIFACILLWILRRKKVVK